MLPLFKLIYNPPPPPKKTTPGMIETSGCLKMILSALKMICSNGKYSWFGLNVLKHAKTTSTVLKKKSLTTTLIATKVIPHLSLEQHTGMWAKQTEGKLLCEATAHLFTNESEMEKRQFLLDKEAITSLSTVFCYSYHLDSLLWIRYYHQVLSARL